MNSYAYTWTSKKLPCLLLFSNLQITTKIYKKALNQYFIAQETNGLSDVPSLCFWSEKVIGT